jgi:hypothetical protein
MRSGALAVGRHSARKEADVHLAGTAGRPSADAARAGWRRPLLTGGLFLLALFGVLLLSGTTASASDDVVPDGTTAVDPTTLDDPAAPPGWPPGLPFDPPWGAILTPAPTPSTDVGPADAGGNDQDGGTPGSQEPQDGVSDPGAPHTSPDGQPGQSGSGVPSQPQEPTPADPAPDPPAPPPVTELPAATDPEPVEPAPVAEPVAETPPVEVVPVEQPPALVETVDPPVEPTAETVPIAAVHTLVAPDEGAPSEDLTCSLPGDDAALLLDFTAAPQLTTATADPISVTVSPTAGAVTKLASTGEPAQPVAPATPSAPLPTAPPAPAGSSVTGSGGSSVFSGGKRDAGIGQQAVIETADPGLPTWVSTGTTTGAEGSVVAGTQNPGARPD